MAHEEHTLMRFIRLRDMSKMRHLAPMPVGEVHNVLRTAGFAEEGELLTVHQGTTPRGRHQVLCACAPNGFNRV